MFTKSKFISVALMLCVIFTSGCVQQNEVRPYERFEDKSYPNDEALIQAFSERVVDGFNRSDARFFLNRVWAGKFANRMLEGTELTPVSRRDLREYILDDAKRMLLQDIANYGKGYWSVIGITADGEDLRSHLRFDSEYLNFRYVDIIFMKDSGKQLFIVDIQDKELNMTVSSFQRSFWRYLLGNEAMKSDAKNRLTHAEEKAWEEYAELLKKDDPRKALAKLSSFPPSMLRDPLFISEHMRHSSQIDEQHIDVSIARFVAQFESATTLLHVSHYINQKDYVKAVQVLDSLEFEMGSDAGIYILRANIEAEQDKFKKAMFYYHQALLLEPDNYTTYWAILAKMTKNEMYDEAIVVVDALSQRFLVNFTALENSDDISEGLTSLFHSAQYKKWKEKG